MKYTKIIALLGLLILLVDVLPIREFSKLQAQIGFGIFVLGFLGILGIQIQRTVSNKTNNKHALSLAAIIFISGLFAYLMYGIAINSSSATDSPWPYAIEFVLAVVVLFIGVVALLLKK